MDKNNKDKKQYFRKYYDFVAASSEIESLVEAVLYCIIYSFPNKAFRGRQSVLAKWCKVKSPKTVREALYSLRDKGLISIEAMGGKFGMFRKYTILRDPVVENNIMDEKVELALDELEFFQNSAYYDR